MSGLLLNGRQQPAASHTIDIAIFGAERWAQQSNPAEHGTTDQFFNIVDTLCGFGIEVEFDYGFPPEGAPWRVLNPDATEPITLNLGLHTVGGHVESTASAENVAAYKRIARPLGYAGLYNYRETLYVDRKSQRLMVAATMKSQLGRHAVRLRGTKLATQQEVDTYFDVIAQAVFKPQECGIGAEVPEALKNMRSREQLILLWKLGERGLSRIPDIRRG